MRKFKHKITGDIATIKVNNSSFYTYDGLDIHARIIENSNDWEEIIEKDYEILEIHYNNPKVRQNRIVSYKNDICTECKETDGTKINYLNVVKLSQCTPEDWKYITILKIRRKSDGVEFKIGDKVYWNWQYSPQKYYTIEGFSINKEDNSLDFYTKGSCKYSWIFNKIQHYKEPILTTEDGYEMYEGDKVYFVEIGEYLHKGC